MSYLETFLNLIATKTPFVEIVLVDAKGSTPADAGSKALVTSEGIIWGTVGGGKVEVKALAHAKDLIEKKTKLNDFVVWNLQHDVGMTCGGEVKFFFDFHFVKTWEIVVFGAGHVSQSLVRTFLNLDCQLTCVDARAEWINKLPEGNGKNFRKLQLSQPKDFVSELSKDAFCILMTQGHATDFPILRELLNQNKGKFIGVIGSHSKRLVLQRELREAGVEESKLNSFYCPLGLPVGNSSPAEISISIASQLLMFRDGSGLRDLLSDKKWQYSMRHQNQTVEISEDAETTSPVEV